MSTQLNDKVSRKDGMHPRKKLILDALRHLHATDGQERAGPTDIARAAQRAGLGEISPALVTTHLKGLVADDLVERLPQGKRRALYRLAEVV